MISHTTNSEEFSFLLPLATAQEIVRLMNTYNAIQVFPSVSHIAVHSESTELSSPLIDGSYPDYRQIIPSQFRTTPTTTREALQRALKTLLVFLPRDSRRVEVRIHPKPGEVTLKVGGSGT